MHFVSANKKSTGKKHKNYLKQSFISKGKTKLQKIKLKVELYKYVLCSSYFEVSSIFFPIKLKWEGLNYTLDPGLVRVFNLILIQG